MHVLQLLDFSPPHGGGTIAQLQFLATSFARSGDRLTLAFPRERAWCDRLRPQATVRILPQMRRPLHPGFRRRVADLCRSEAVDLVHLHFSFAMAAGLTPGAARDGPPVIYQWHNPPRVLLPPEARPPAQPGAGIAWAPRWACAAAARFVDRRIIRRHVTVSGAIAELLIRHGWTRAEKIVRLPNAIAPPLSETATSRDGAQTAGSVHIGCVADFRPQKDHATLLRAFARLRERRPACRLTLVGDGPTRRGIESLAATLGVAEAVAFAGSVADAEEVLRDFDILVLPTHYEGQGLVLLEAMRHGLAIVASAVGGVTETVRHEVEGLLVAPRDAGELAEALLRLAADPELRLRLGRAGRARIAEHHDIDGWSQALRGLYRVVLIAHRGG